MDAPASPPNVPLSLKQLRKARARQLLKRLALFVGLPTAIATVYFGLIASDQFESISPVTVQSAEQQTSLGLESLIGVVPGAASSRDALTIREYILSREVLQRLDKEHSFIAHYRSKDADWFSRLGEDATFEDAYEYYEDKVRVDYDTMSGVLTVSVLAFDAQSAQRFATAILSYSEEMVNDLAERARADGLHFAEDQVERAEQRLSKARAEVLKLQGQGADLNPEQTAAAAITIRSELQAELARARAELSEAQAFMRSDAPKVVALRQRVAALVKQVSRENNRMIGGGEAGGMHNILAEFEPALLEKEFSQAAYASALKSLELAHAEVGRQHRYLATIAPPSLADEPTHPRRVYGIVTVFFLSIAIFVVGSLLIAAFREHARI